MGGLGSRTTEIDPLKGDLLKALERADEFLVRAQKAEARCVRTEEALRKGQAFERAYQESLGATPTTAQWERLESLQSAFLDAYLEVLG